MCKIPNFAFGKVTTHAIVWVFLPCMYDRHDSPVIPSSNLQLIYNQCL